MSTKIEDPLDLYTLERHSDSDSQKLLVTIQVNKNHSIFEGHFPGMPILPGVCIMQMVKDSLNRFLDGDYQLKTASVVKFLVPVEREKHSSLRMEIDWSESEVGVKISATSFLEDETAHFKLKGEYTRL